MGTRASRVMILQQDVTTLEAETSASQNPSVMEQFQQLEREIEEASQALVEVRQELTALTARKVTMKEFREAQELFDPVREVL